MLSSPSSPFGLQPLEPSGEPQVRTIELIEDDPSMRRALGLAFEREGFIVRAYTSRQEFMLARRPAGLRIVLLDMRLPDASGLEIRDWLVGMGDTAPVIFISGESTPQEIIDAIKGGADDFLLKPVRLDLLLAAVERGFDLARKRSGNIDRSSRLIAGWSRLTRREREVCVLMLKGLTNREIARLHGSVPGTVKVHRGRVLQKLEARTLSEVFAMVGDEDLEAWLAREVEGE